jgi:hypothetical protein
LIVTFTPDLQLQTLFVLNQAGRIISTREPNSSPGPRFALIRGSTACAWAAHADVPDLLAGQLDALARTEPPTRDCRDEPVHTTRYTSLVGGRVDFGPAFTFPDAIPAPVDIVAVTQLSELTPHFRGWTADELPDRSPILAIAEEGHAASVCFCARRSAVAAEAGVETAERFRGRGLAPRVAAAWALAIRASGLLPLYSTSWSNAPSLAVARKLGLEACASDWSLSE